MSATSTEGCPALHILRGTLLRETPTGRMKKRPPEHAVGDDGRCRHCHTTITTPKRRRR